MIVGGGPAGAAAGRLLALWGHRVTLCEKGSDPARALAESIPPSTQKLLHQIGVADAVARAGFLRTRGNTVWWASRERRVETFGDDDAFAYQVFRPDFDRVLMASAAEAGVDVRRGAQVRHVALDDGDGVRVDYTDSGSPATVRAEYVLDCSGRAGIVARRFRLAEPGFRTCALVGIWRRDAGASWGLPDDSHTAVETFSDGWGWSVPTSPAVRHVGVMIGRTMADGESERTLAAAYHRALHRAAELSKLVAGAALERVWACDASLYSSTAFAGPRHALVGDAGSFIDPLSSFGVKKALASAWMAAVATHTALMHPERSSVAFDFFSSWERHLYATHLRRSREFAQAAIKRHPDEYWGRRAGAGARDVDIEEDLTDDPAVQRAFAAFKAAECLNLALSSNTRVELRPVVRGNEIVLEPALIGPRRAGEAARPQAAEEADAADRKDAIRFVANVDLLMLAQMAPHHTQVPELFEAYCRTCAPVPLPSVVGGLSLLVARGILHERG